MSQNNHARSLPPTGGLNVVPGINVLGVRHESGHGPIGAVLTWVCFKWIGLESCMSRGWRGIPCNRFLVGVTHISGGKQIETKGSDGDTSSQRRICPCQFARYNVPNIQRCEALLGVRKGYDCLCAMWLTSTQNGGKKSRKSRCGGCNLSSSPGNSLWLFLIDAWHLSSHIYHTCFSVMCQVGDMLKPYERVLRAQVL